MTYEPPVDDIMFALKTAADLPALLADGIYDGIDEETIRAVIEEAGKFGAEVLAPLNRTGDVFGSKLANGRLETPPGWADAYRQFALSGWSALPCPEDYGGQGLPGIVASAACEIWNSANTSFGLCPLLTQGAIDAIEAGGSEQLKAKFLPKMVSGAWTGTMNLTEPQAGSDLSAVTTKALPQGDGSYLITGTKIYITYGEHEMAENIIHLVLARLPGAPAGTRGISLFLVPKFMVGDDGSLGARNDVLCVGIEHKLGIKASPTCTMKFGEQGGATGYLVGEENRGLVTMFVMMNAARLAVGLQGVGIAERATQKAVHYAAERKQGKAASDPSGMPVSIDAHADVRRTLLTMRALTAAARSICLVTSREFDLSKRASDKDARANALNRGALLTPVAKAFSTDIGCEVASLGVQVHGGMGFVEETGAAQYMRDARILPIYEGTNGIQAIDLVTRKLPLAGGATVAGIIAEFQAIADEAGRSNDAALGHTAERIGDAIEALRQSTAWLMSVLPTQPDAALAGATPYLRLFGLAAGGSLLAKSALAVLRDGGDAKHVALARFFAENLAVAAPGLAVSIMTGYDSVVSPAAA